MNVLLFSSDSKCLMLHLASVGMVPLLTQPISVERRAGQPGTTPGVTLATVFKICFSCYPPRLPWESSLPTILASKLQGIVYLLSNVSSHATYCFI